FVFGTDDAVSHSVPALVLLERVARGLPGRRPELVRLVVAQVDVTSAQIKGSVVVAISREPSQPRVAIKRISAGRVGDDSEIGLATQVIHPGQRRIRLRDHIFPVLIVKITKLHELCSSTNEFFQLSGVRMQIDFLAAFWLVKTKLELYSAGSRPRQSFCS